MEVRMSHNVPLGGGNSSKFVKQGVPLPTIFSYATKKRMRNLIILPYKCELQMLMKVAQDVNLMSLIWCSFVDCYPTPQRRTYSVPGTGMQITADVNKAL